ncbi:MAG: DUF4389 domain-containing protein [Chloroflexota bacterium]
MAQPSVATPYPASLSVEFPDRNLNRLTSFFRIFTIIPIMIILALLIGSNSGSGWNEGARESMRRSVDLGGIGITFLPLVLMILFRQKYPRWWYDWNLALTKFSNRVGAYLLLLRDEYPSTDEEQTVHIDFPYPDVKSLNRWLPLIKWLLAIPHIIVLAVLAIAVLVVWVIAWFAILFTGRYPRAMFDFIVGWMRWGLRVEAYALLLITDRYPPFSLSP